MLPCRRDPQHTILGYAWGSSDEKKMQNTFRLGKADVFTNFLDLQTVSESLGYQQMGLASLTQMVLGCASYKSKKVRSGACHMLQHAASVVLRLFFSWCFAM